MKPTKEQIQWLWEQCGFEYSDDWSSTCPYKDPQGVILHSWKGIDLNNLWKYAVPTVIDRIMTEQECSSDVAYGILFKKWLQELELNIPHAALALFWAIYKCLGGKE